MSLLAIRSRDLEIHQAPVDGKPVRGLYVGRGGFTGWDDQPVTRRSTTDRPNAHGEFDVPGFLAGRLITVDGWCIASSPVDLQEWRDLVTGHGADGSSFPLRIERAGTVESATARLAAGQKTTFIDNGTGRRASFSMSWWCADPRRYRKPDPEDVDPPGPSIRITNRGNFPATPRLIVRTSTTLPSGYTITGPGGRQIVVLRELHPGGVHEIDLATGRIYENGVRIMRAFARLQLWAVPAHGTVTVSVNGGTIAAQMQHTSV